MFREFPTMTAAELIEKLQQLPPDALVVVCGEEGLQSRADRVELCWARPWRGRLCATLSDAQHDPAQDASAGFGRAVVIA